MVHFQHAGPAGRAVVRAVGLWGSAFLAVTRAPGGFDGEGGGGGRGVGGQRGIAGGEGGGGDARGGEDGSGVGPVEKDVEGYAEERGPDAWGGYQLELRGGRGKWRRRRRGTYQ